MRNRLIGSILAVVAVLAVSPVILAQTPAGPGSGAVDKAIPDLSGIWARPGFHPELTTQVGKEEVPLIPPMQPWAAERYKAIQRATDANNSKLWDAEGRNVVEHAIDPFRGACVPAGMPRVYFSRVLFDMYQVPGRVIQIFEASSGVRTIYTDGRKHRENAPPTFTGHSIGRWDGDTLVVDTVGLRGNDETWLDRGGHPHTEALHVVERIRRVKQDTLEVDLLFDDPKAYTKPWGGKVAFELRPGWELMENLNCEEHFQLDHMPEVRRLLKELSKP